MISLLKAKNAVVIIDQKNTDDAPTDDRVNMTGTNRVILPAVRTIRADRADPRTDMTIAATITDSERTTVPVITGTESITAAVTQGVGATIAADMTDRGTLTLTAQIDLNIAAIRGIRISLYKKDKVKNRLTSSGSLLSRPHSCW